MVAMFLEGNQRLGLIHYRLLIYSWLLSLSSPEVDLVFLAQNPLVFASQVGDAEELLGRRKDGEG